MNKELIKKYKVEFNYWLNGGELLYSYIDDKLLWKSMDEIDKNTYPVYIRNPFQLSEHHIIIINDKYVEFRKALAEGKIVEVAVDYNDIDGYIWKSVEDDEFHHFNIDEIRIKPEAPKFKAGDWVAHNGVYKQVTKAVDGLIDSLDNQVAVIMKDESLELWEPNEKEYFWYKNDLVKFHETQKNLGLLLQSARGCSYYPAEKNFEDFCEPYIGKLPSNLKQDNKIV